MQNDQVQDLHYTLNVKSNPQGTTTLPMSDLN